ncbi:unnamed protein product, partial [Rotaria socialis]
GAKGKEQRQERSLLSLTTNMPEPAPRRSLAARRTRKLSEFDADVDEKENSLNDSLTGRRQSR